ncbi:hypothetical protein EV121DRAFT_195731 [Schizophyllum commune]
MASVAGTSLAAQAESESDAPSQPLPLYTWREFSPDARLWYCKTVSEANDAVDRIRSDSVGFDMEWKPVYVSGQAENRVALVQVADGDHIVLVQVSQMQLFPEQLRLLLEDPSIAKTGVGISGDAQKLYRDRGISMSNVVDLGLMTRSTDNANWKGPYNSPIGLARLIALYEKRELRKGRISRSNWEKVPLSDEQKQYAANDAHCAWLLYARLRTLITTMAKPPKPVCYTFDAVRGRLCEPSTTAEWVPANPDYDPGPPPPKLEPYLWSKFSPNAQLKYCKTVEEADAAVAAITSRAVGFDIVLRRPKKDDELPDKHVAMVLLADEHWVILIHLERMHEVFPDKLRKLLQNTLVVKAGSSTQLYMQYGVPTANIVDLSLLARSVDSNRWKKGSYEDLLTLRELIAAYDEHAFPKNSDGFPKDLDWRLPLTPELMLYAANSAHGRWHVYTKLAALLGKMAKQPLPAYYTYDVSSGALCHPGTSTPWVPHNPDYKRGAPPGKGKGKGGQQKKPPPKGAQQRPLPTSASPGGFGRGSAPHSGSGAPSTSAAPPIVHTLGYIEPVSDAIAAIQARTAARQARPRPPNPGFVNTMREKAQARQQPVPSYLAQRGIATASSPQAHQEPPSSTSGASTGPSRRGGKGGNKRRK